MLTFRGSLPRLQGPELGKYAQAADGIGMQGAGLMPMYFEKLLASGLPIGVDAPGLPVMVEVPAALGTADMVRGGPFSVKHSFVNSTIMLTGATGYLGSLNLELLLRACPSCKIITTIRSKLDASPRKRMEKLLTRQLFKQFADQKEQVMSRITVLDAELAGPNCGIHERDLPELARVDYIIHCAASIRFDLPIHVMMKQNYTTTSTLLDLAAKHMPRIKCFTYVSTAFVNFAQPDGTCVKEKLYPIRKGGQWQDDIQLAEELIAMSNLKATKKANVVMKEAGFLNTYMLSKNLTEKMVMMRDGKSTPIVIVRPSLVGCIAGKPCPGYIGNTSGFTGLLLGIGSGIITMSNHDPKRVFPLVPADIVSATTVAATAAVGADAGTKKLFAPRIVHACTSSTMPVSGERLQILALNFVNEDPVEKRLTWRKTQQFINTSSTLHYKLHCLLNGVKLKLFSFVLRIAGHPRVAEKIMDMWEQYQLVGLSKAQIRVTFGSKNAVALHDMMPKEELSSFKILWREDQQDSWMRYIRTYCAGAKHFYLNQPPKIFDVQDFCPVLRTTG